MPHPLVLLLGCVLIAAALTHVLPPGEFERREHPETGRTVVVAGTYRSVEASPVGAFRAFVAVPRGIVAAAEVVVLVLLVSGAWVVVDRAGTLPRLVEVLANRFSQRRRLVIPILALAFAAGGALENMQEEIIPLIPSLLLLARAIGYQPFVVAASSVGAAAVGSAFSPINPFQAGIAGRLAELPPLEAAGLRITLLLIALGFWIFWTIRHAERTATAPAPVPRREPALLGGRHVLILLVIVAPLLAYVVGSLRWGWGFNELSAGFVIAGLLVGLIARMGPDATVRAYLDGAASVTTAALLVGVARGISVVLEDGRIIDTILQSLTAPLAGSPPALAAMLMIPVQALIHIPVPSVSGQAVLTMPVFVPMADLLGLSRQAVVLAYQTGAGLTELWTPTNGALMAVLLAAGVPFGRWIRFAVPAVGVITVIGAAGVLMLSGGG